MFSGQETYEHGLHELRQTFLPHSKSDQSVASVIPGCTLTWEELNLYVIKSLALLLLVSGTATLMNKRCAGGSLLILAVALIIVVKDNPWRRHTSQKTKAREINERTGDLLKNLSLVGSAFVMMWHRGSGKCCQ